jgi:predicted XRE-type DNA-binding protein
MTKKRSKKIPVFEGSGNVFADVGLDAPEGYLAKAELARQIINVIGARRLTQVRAATLLGVGQPKISALRNGHLDGFSTDRLIRFLNTLGRDVRIVVTAKPRSRLRARLTVMAA